MVTGEGGNTSWASTYRPAASFTGHHQRTIDDIGAQGGLAIVAHPNWSWLPETRGLGWHGYHAIEILNVVCNYLEYNGFALQWWDCLLRHGVRVWGIAADDAHRIPYHGARGWIVVNADTLSAAAIVEGIRTGNFTRPPGRNSGGSRWSGRRSRSGARRRWRSGS